MVPPLVPIIGVALSPGSIVGGAAVVGVIVGIHLLSRFFRSPVAPNPSIAEIEARQEAERARAAAQKAVNEATALADLIRRDADAERKLARVRQEEADRAVVRAAAEVERMKAQMEEGKRVAQRAQRLAEEASKAAMEDAARLAEEACKEMERAERMREEAETGAQVAKEDAERTKKAADEERRKAEAGKAKAEEAARAADNEARKAREARDEAERKLKEGIYPVITPSPQELAAAKKRVQYEESYFHFAVAGISGSGKSSLVNAFRGLRSRDARAAAVGVTETTMEMTRYPDTHPQSPFIWYDMPGAGTLRCPDWQYFNNQGLYVFDCIVILFDNRFTMTDIAILINCKRFKIPTYIVRSKADQHIANIIKKMGEESDDEDEGDLERHYEEARRHFIEQTRKSVKAHLEDANLPDQRVYIVSDRTLLNIVREKTPKKTIDEMELLNDLYGEAHIRRSAQSHNGVDMGIGLEVGQAFSMLP